MALVKIILDKRKAKADGSYPICFQICPKGKPLQEAPKFMFMKVIFNQKKAYA